jgi:hypothetical protein
MNKVKGKHICIMKEYDNFSIADRTIDEYPIAVKIGSSTSSYSKTEPNVPRAWCTRSPPLLRRSLRRSNGYNGHTRQHCPAKSLTSTPGRNIEVLHCRRHER